MADELTLQFVVPGRPEDVQVAWRMDPPAALRAEGFSLEDEAYNSLTWGRVYFDWPQKLLFVSSLGLLLLFRSWFASRFRLTSRFDADRAGTRVTLSGFAHPQARRRLLALADAHGGQLALTPSG
jgi:hypothetical protein